MAKSIFTTPGLSISNLMTRVAEAMGWDSTDSSRNTEIEQAITAAGQAACTFEGRPWWWSRGRGTFRTKKYTIANIANSGAIRSSDVASITTTVSHLLGEGQYVLISGCSDSTFDGAYRVSDIADADTFKIAQEGDTVGNTTAGDGTVNVITYPLRKVNTSSMQDLWAPRSVWRDTEGRLKPITKDEFDLWLSFPNPAGAPWQYCLFDDDYQAVTGGYSRQFYIGLMPAPDLATYNIHIPYIVRHSRITDGDSGSEDASLIVPAEFHRGVYVDGAVWLLKHDTQDPTAVANSDTFQAVMRRMQGADPTGYDDEYHGLGLPSNVRVFTNVSDLSP